MAQPLEGEIEISVRFFGLSTSLPCSSAEQRVHVSFEFEFVFEVPLFLSLLLSFFLSLTFGLGTLIKLRFNGFIILSEAKNVSVFTPE